MIISCEISSNVPEWLDEMKNTLENFFGVKFEDITEKDSKKKCKCKNCCCKKQTTEFDNVEDIEHIN